MIADGRDKIETRQKSPRQRCRDYGAWPNRIRPVVKRSEVAGCAWILPVGRRSTPARIAHEQDGLRELAAYLPDADPFHVWANVEFVGTDGSINEIDALVLTPSGLCILELKHWQGELSGDGTQWVRRPPHGRLTPEDNPYILANRKAKRLAGLIKHYARRQGREAAGPFVGAAVFLHARDFRSRLDAIGRQHVYGLDGVRLGAAEPQGLSAGATQPTRHTSIDAARGREIVELVKGAKIRPSVANRRIGQLILHGRPLAEGVGWQDFLAGHQLDRDSGAAGAVLPGQPGGQRGRAGDQAGRGAGVPAAAGRPASGHHPRAGPGGSPVGAGGGLRPCHRRGALRPVAGPT